MSLEQYLSSPWTTSHPAYRGSAFGINPAPEFATAEVILASTYRACGFAGHSEKSVPEWGRKFERFARKNSAKKANTISQDTWRTILHSALESPKQPKQSARRFLQMCPIVPDVALYSGSARTTGNSWDPGVLVRRVIRLGASSVEQAASLWYRLYEALSVDMSDDVWARWLQSEFERRRLPERSWQAASFESDGDLRDQDKEGVRFPAQLFNRDLAAVIDAKPCMTRRQWISLLEATLRLGTVTHVMWLCEVNQRLWRELEQVLAGGETKTELELRQVLLAGSKTSLVYGAPALPIVRKLASSYLDARLSTNLLLWYLEEDKAAPARLQSIQDVMGLMSAIAKNREMLTVERFAERLEILRDVETRAVTCKKGIGSNLMEFSRHTLGQRQTADESLRGYDQGYFLRKQGTYAAAPWVVSIGPVALLALVHACLAEVDGPRSVRRLCEHLACYGIEVNHDNIGKSEIGQKLRMLGLVLDSPDAESGMLLVPPFERFATVMEDASV